MKITALTNSKPINLQLANYTLSLFEQTKVEVVDYTELDSKGILAKIEEANLVIVILDGGTVLNHDVLSKKSILLMATFIDGSENKTNELMKSTIAKLKKSGYTIWGTYTLLATADTFNSESEIKNIGKRLDLIRMLNSIMFHNLKIRNNNKFSCGITPPKHYVGDSIGY
tara:strand:- start:1118 stop:1627 length:510 start_codon:yes stop_codon:yes gene_type:complete